MNDLPPLPLPQPKPFEPERMRGGTGCQKPILIGCGLVALLLGVAAVVFLVKVKDVLAYAMNELQAEVVAHLPEDASAGERRELTAGFDAALVRIRTGKIDPAALQELQKKLVAVASAASSRRLSREELTGLISALDKFNRAGSAPAAPDAATEPAAPQAQPDETSRPPAP